MYPQVSMKANLGRFGDGRRSLRNKCPKSECFEEGDVSTGRLIPDPFFGYPVFWVEGFSTATRTLKLPAPRNEPTGTIAMIFSSA